MSLLMRPMSEIREQMERILSDLTEETGYPSILRSEWKPLRLNGTHEKAWLPAVEVSETEKNYIIKAEIPGMKPEDIEVEVLNNIVNISGEIRQEKKDEKHNIYRSELRYGRFMRQIPLPGSVKSGDIIAEFRNGILELYLPKQEETRRIRIKVDVQNQK